MSKNKDSMQELYEKVKALINTVDFEAIWEGFHPFAFALYDDESVYMDGRSFPVDRRFLANTAICFEGRYIAIWHIPGPAAEEDTDLLCANLVHEMFHAYQQSEGEHRYPNDLAMLCLPDDLSYYLQKLEENRLLCRALNTDGRQKQQLLLKFVLARRARQLQFGNIVTQEFYVETIEGLAEYAGSTALRQLSPQKYQAKIEEYQRLLSEAGPLLFDIRRLQYYAGTIFCLVLQETGTDFRHDIRTADDTLFGLVYARFAAQENRLSEETTPDNFSAVQAACDQYRKMRQACFDRFLALPREEISGSWLICGYDPMNMIRRNDQILCSHFVTLAAHTASAGPKTLTSSGKACPETLFINGPVLLTLKPGTYNEVLHYSTAAPHSSV